MKLEVIFIYIGNFQFLRSHDRVSTLLPQLFSKQSHKKSFDPSEMTGCVSTHCKRAVSVFVSVSVYLPLAVVSCQRKGDGVQTSTA